jgi:hypothetical protein
LRCVVAYRDRPGRRADRFFCTALGGQFNHRHDVIFVAVNAASREQAHDVNGFASSNGFIDRAHSVGLEKKVRSLISTSRRVRS